MDPIQELKTRLAEHPELDVKVFPTSVIVQPPTRDGFLVSFRSSAKRYVVHFDGWHQEFESADEALNCFAFGFSDKARLAVTYRGRTPVKWVLECLDEGQWRADSEVGSFLAPFWLASRIVHRQNPNLFRDGLGNATATA